jgi:ferredoxin
MTTTQRLFLKFPKCETEKPIVYHLVRDHNLQINIFRAKVTPDEEGYLVLDVTGEPEDILRGMEYVKTFDVTIDPFNKDVAWDPRRCTHCGNCLPHCPTGALHIANDKTREVAFDEALCVECLACLDDCPFDACTAAF